MPDSVENRIRRFYDEEGWTLDDTGRLKDTARWGHTKAGHREFAVGMTERIAAVFSEGGELFLNCGCGPFTASAMAYSANCGRRVWSRMRFYPERKSRRLRAQGDAEDLRIRRNWAIGWIGQFTGSSCTWLQRCSGYPGNLQLGVIGDLQT